jgi:hypothetical protein
MHASSYRGLMQVRGAFLFLRSTANQNATSLRDFSLQHSIPYLYHQVFGRRDELRQKEARVWRFMIDV